MNARKNRAPTYARPDNLIAAELRQRIAAAAPDVADRIGGLNVAMMANDQYETEISFWIDGDPMPREIKITVPFTAAYEETVAAVLLEAAMIPAPVYADAP